MNDYIKSLLNKCKVAELPDDLDSNDIIIEKTSALHLLVDNCYTIRINKDKLGNIKFPNLPELDVEVTDISTDEVKVYSPLWDGWLPKKSVKVIKKL